MDPLVLTILACVAVGGAIGGAMVSVLRQNTQRIAEGRFPRWRAAAKLCRLTEVEELRSSVAYELRGRSGPWDVVFTTYERRDETGTTVVIRPAGDQAETRDLLWLTLRPRRLGTALEQRLFGVSEVDVGDPEVDRWLFVGGETPLVRAAFDADTRRVLALLLTDVRLEVAYGRLQAELPETARLARDRFTRAVRQLIEVADRLARPADVAHRLAQNALRDPLPRVRLENLLLLASAFPKDPVTRETQLEACQDPDDEVRLRAAMGLGEEGREVLLALAASGPDGHGARAVAALARYGDPERLQAILKASRRVPRRIETARACLTALARSRTSQAVGALATVIVMETEELAVAAAHALGMCRLAIAEPPLLDALEREEAPALRVAAAEALGRCASARAVPALKQAEARHPHDGALRRAARQAIAEIQVRATGASPGQLSLTAGETGQLSLAAEDSAGQLSVPDEDERGRLSLPPRRP